MASDKLAQPAIDFNLIHDIAILNNFHNYLDLRKEKFHQNWS